MVVRDPLDSNVKDESMKLFERGLIALTALVVLTVAGPATAQIPDEFTNLKVLPEDIGKRDLVNIMRGFAGAIGKRCNYCHVGENPSDPFPQLG